MLCFPRFVVPTTRQLGLRIVRPQCRPYTKRGKSTKDGLGPLVRRARQPPPQREVWVDPFKAPPPPRPDYRVLIKPAIFTALVLAFSDPLADFFLNQRTTKSSSRAERQFETQSTLIPIIATNVGVFLLWRVFPSFLHRIGAVLVPYAPSPAQLVVATFSHQDMWHLAFNMLAFWMFGSVVCDTIGREHFLALYFKAATVSSLASLSASQFLVSRGFWKLDHLTRGSLGASGVVYSFLGISALLYPEMRFGLIFIPFVFLPLKFVFPGVMVFDITGVALRWSSFDHVAHVWLLLFKEV
jgi:membrane associated rhomboid family serine protease